MKKIICVLGAIVILCMVSGQTVKVMSFNIHAGYDAPIKEIAEFIKSQNPDIVALQEVEYYTDRSGLSASRSINNNVDMLTQLAYYTGMQGLFFPIINVHGGKFGNAVLSRYGIIGSENILLPYAEGTEQRAASACRIALPDNITVTFISTHLDMSDLVNGMNQVKRLNELVNENDLMMLGGDINRRVSTDEVNELCKFWELAFSNYFDHIAFFPKKSWTVTSQTVFTGNTLSDHLPIMVTLQLMQ